MLEAPEPAASPAASWTAAWTIAAVATLVLAGSFQLASHVIEPTSDTELERLEWISANPERANLAKSLDVLALPFLLGTTLVYVLLSRQRSPRLADTGGILLGTGFVGLAAIEGFEALLFILVEDGRFDLGALADVTETGYSSGPGLVIILLFLLPALVGLIVLAAALWRSGAVPRGAVVLIAGAVAVDVVLSEGESCRTGPLT